MSGLARRVPTAIAYGVVIVAALLGPWPMFAGLMFGLLLLSVVELAILYRGRPERAAVVVVGAVYVAVGLSALVLLRVAEHPFVSQRPEILAAVGITGPAWLLLALMPTWSADIASYAVGSAVGRRQIAPRISPGKTWEGTLGGFAAAAIVAYIVGTAFGLPPKTIAVVAVGLGPVALAGDLFESWMKRRVGAKDSGSILPGHGGILDRIDSLLTVGPFIALVLLVTLQLGWWMR